MISIKGNVRWITKLWLDLVPVSPAWFSPYTWQIITVCQLDEHINWISFWLSSSVASVVVLVAIVVVAVFHKALNFCSSDWPIDPCFANRIGIARQIVFIVIIANANIPNPSPSPSQSPLRLLPAVCSHFTCGLFVDCSAFDFEIDTNDCYGKECVDCLLIGWQVSWVVIVMIVDRIGISCCGSSRWWWGCQNQHKNCAMVACFAVNVIG